MYLRTEADSPANTATKAKGKNKKKPRQRPLPPDVTSRNLAIEKRRRQDQNRTFLDLARCLPKLASTKRLTKNLIVGESLQHHRRQRSMCIAAGRELRELLSAHNNAVLELNMLKSQLGMPLGNGPWTPFTALTSLMDVENQPCGEFPDGFGSPGESEGREQQSEEAVGNAEEPFAAFSNTQDPNVLPLDVFDSILPHNGLQNQAPGQPPNAQGILTDIDWWESNASGLDLDFMWDDMPAEALPSLGMSEDGMYRCPSETSMPYF
ncbi:hypothetical protein PRZ48_006754 [Zasmidium cellare]|uniref:BHLH domain-containing protein n=1 Tax=Zasmidium cellare TaxID=395010 RepID=A0ABR0EIR9_ZASCE|nr:hypothetical protein PRZ48_006754 [Zasmidium cellare]